MDIPEQAHTHPYGDWPGNELEEVLAASVGVPGAGARIVEALGRSHVWVPLPNGGGPDSATLDLPAMEVDGQAYVPVFSSQRQLALVTGEHAAFTVAPAVEFARGLPPQLGIVLNPDGAVGVPLPPPAVAELCRAGRTLLDGPTSGGRVRLYEPNWQEDPVDLLTAAGEEFQQTGVVRTARRALAVVEDQDPVLFIGVELSQWEGTARDLPMDALGRALGRVPVAWPVNLVLLDVAQDPVGDWLKAKVRPFFQGAY
ncbi:enhanced serine sensitivity protein SseB [Streptomyces tsukubensis]|uniref:Enhanced serine sensitivity protein SseB n=1 Tax=Streptomyces tsukubensis TaxID=83656 RepID=A0A1V4A8Y1_9ACTN|nr:enhanced serine sensitivity protein SseB [Streptomyces tsukubensis]OON79666.1 enhanced serine sensitivity protein SseB [Streptomyces tsukubensis]QFR95853.1 enhanced serine sensitivity protein SseB [Streptomyces tsukubensis]